MCFETCVVPIFAHVPASGCLTSGWHMVGSQGDSLAWAEVPDVQAHCTRTGQCHQLIAQEVETLFGYDEAHTAPLLQEGAPGDCKDRGSVEARRLRALRRAWPVCFVELVLQPAASHAEVEIGSPPSKDIGLSSFPDLDNTVLLASYLACPFLSDRKARGQSCQQVGPDWADMHAFQVAKPSLLC